MWLRLQARRFHAPPSAPPFFRTVLCILRGCSRSHIKPPPDCTGPHRPAAFPIRVIREIRGETGLGNTEIACAPKRSAGTADPTWWLSMAMRDSSAAAAASDRVGGRVATSAAGVPGPRVGPRAKGRPPSTIPGPYRARNTPRSPASSHRTSAGPSALPARDQDSPGSRRCCRTMPYRRGGCRGAAASSIRHGTTTAP